MVWHPVISRDVGLLDGSQFSAQPIQLLAIHKTYRCWAWRAWPPGCSMVLLAQGLAMTMWNEGATHISPQMPRFIKAAVRLFLSSFISSYQHISADPSRRPGGRVREEGTRHKEQESADPAGSSKRVKKYLTSSKEQEQEGRRKQRQEQKDSKCFVGSESKVRQDGPLPKARSVPIWMFRSHRFRALAAEHFEAWWLDLDWLASTGQQERTRSKSKKTGESSGKSKKTASFL